MPARMMMFYVPEDQEVLAVLGEIALRHEHLNHILKMTIKSLTGVTPSEAVRGLKHVGSRELRDRIKKLAKKKLGDGDALIKLQALLTQAGDLSQMRNDLVHGLWAQELDGDTGLQSVYGEIEKAPDLEELRKLANDLEELMIELNKARLEGFLKDAIEAA